ncbi:MAG: hypothetical protein LCH63_09175 [Candidatus Melainabacteria bacterium]|nr:hypothetical protein [Candidatus Melainabacteria bacterium]
MRKKQAQAKLKVLNGGFLLSIFIWQTFAPVLAQPALLRSEEFVSLKQNENTGVSAWFNDIELNSPGETFVLAVDGKPLQKLSLEEIKKLLDGPYGSTLSLELADSLGQTAVKSVVRQPLIKPTSENLDPFLHFQTLDAANRISFGNLLELSSVNSDILAKASCDKAIEAIEQDGMHYPMAYFNAVLLQQAVGDFASADIYFEKLLKEMNRTGEPIEPSIYFAELVRNLVALGKVSQAEKLCRSFQTLSKARAKEQVGGYRSPQLLELTELYAIIPTSSAKACGLALAKELADEVSSSKAVVFSDEWLRFAQVIQSYGMTESALLICAQLITKPKIERSKFYLHYCKARLEAELGLFAAAENELSSLKDSIAKLPDKQRQLLDRLPAFFPRLADLDSALLSVAKHKVPAAPPSLKPTSLTFDYPADTSGLVLARDAQLLIEQRKFDQVKVKTNKLVSKFADSRAAKAGQAIRQNYFSTCLHLARKLTDCGQLKQSQELLNELKQVCMVKQDLDYDHDISLPMIASELAYINYKKTADPDWQGFWTAMQGTPRAGLEQSASKQASSKDFSAEDSRSNNLRHLAVAFHQAGETKRATLFIDGALQQAEKRPDANGLSLLYTDAARIYACQGDFSLVRTLCTKALAYKPDIDERVANSLVELCQTLDSRGRTQEALEILLGYEKVISLDARAWICGPIDREKALLYMRLGNNLAALSSLKQTFQDDEILSPRDSLLYAQISERLGDSPAAARAYLNAVGPTCTLSESEKEKIIKKAIDLCRSSSKLDAPLLSRAYLELSGLEYERNAELSLSLREKACQLLSDSDKEKPRLLESIVWLKGYLAEKQNSVGYKNIDKQRADRLLRERILFAKRALDLALRQRKGDAVHYYLALALLEVQAGLVDAAINHARQAIETYNSEYANCAKYEYLIDCRLPYALVAAGRSALAASILDEAQSRVDSCAGLGSLPAQIQMMHRFRFCMGQNDFLQAEQILNKFLETDLNQGHYAPPEHNVHICRAPGDYPVEASQNLVVNLFDVIRSASGQATGSLKLRMLEKILAAQKKQFEPNDYRIALTQCALGAYLQSSGFNDKAVVVLQSAMETMHLYENMHYISEKVNPAYFAALEKLHRHSEIESFKQLVNDDWKNWKRKAKSSWRH